NSWAFNLPRGPALREKWALIPADIDVLVTHGPPSGVGDGSGGEEGGYGGGERLGCEELRARGLDVRPVRQLFGHIHDSGGAWPIGGTVFANVTTWECERRATVIDIDVRSRQVTPVEIPPAKR